MKTKLSGSIAPLLASPLFLLVFGHAETPRAAIADAAITKGQRVVKPKAGTTDGKKTSTRAWGQAR